LQIPEYLDNDLFDMINNKQTSLL